MSWWQVALAVYVGFCAIDGALLGWLFYLHRDAWPT
jgi:hypothetical protein